MAASKRVVVKVGTSSLVNDERGTLNLSSICTVCEAITDLKKKGYQVVLVSSGAVGAGCQKLGVDRREVTTLSRKQALAAIGQGALLRLYDDIFTELGVKAAQVLLTLDNLATRSQYNNALATFEELLSMGVVPIVNENDTVAIEELRFGDNDTLSAQVAVIIGAEWLFLLTDVDALYTANPNTNPEARAVRVVEDINELANVVTTKGCGSKYGTGGMATKLTAARLSSAAGCSTVICSSQYPERMQDVIEGNRDIGTCIMPISQRPPKPTKKWILSIPPKGEIKLDVGAEEAVMNRTSLFAAGIIEVTGNFLQQDTVKLVNMDGVEVGRGLVNYTCDEINKILGKNSDEFENVLGYHGPEEIIVRYNIVRTKVDESNMTQAMSFGDLTSLANIGE